MVSPVLPCLARLCCFCALLNKIRKRRYLHITERTLQRNQQLFIIPNRFQVMFWGCVFCPCHARHTISSHFISLGPWTPSAAKNTPTESIHEPVFLQNSRRTVLCVANTLTAPCVRRRGLGKSFGHSRSQHWHLTVIFQDHSLSTQPWTSPGQSERLNRDNNGIGSQRKILGGRST